MGGVIFDLTKQAEPIVWRHPVPVEIQDCWVSDVNPQGGITNSDAELCGLIGGQDVCAQNYDVRHRNITTCCDNTPSVTWSLKGLVSCDSQVASLLRLLALNRRFYRFVPTVTHIAGDTNSMAYDASRLWQISDKELLAYLNLMSPKFWSWKLVALRPRMHSALILSLCKRRSTTGLFTPEQKQTKVAFKNGESSAGPTTWTPSLIRYGTRSCFSKFLLARLEAAYSLTTGSQYAHVLLRHTSVRLGRRSPTWVSGTPASTSTGAYTTVFNGNYEGGKNWMGPRRGSNPSILGLYIPPSRRSTGKTRTRAIASSGSYTWPCFSLTGRVSAR